MMPRRYRGVEIIKERRFTPEGWFNWKFTIGETLYRSRTLARAKDYIRLQGEPRTVIRVVK